MSKYLDYLLNVASETTPTIQEVHILFGHIISLLIEKELYEI
jgi:hypothetical protein